MFTSTLSINTIVNIEKKLARNGTINAITTAIVLNVLVTIVQRALPLSLLLERTQARTG